MPKPNQEAVLKALADFISFGREIGLPKAVQPLERFETEFRTTKPTLKILKETVSPLIDRSFSSLQERVLDTWRNPRPGMKKHEEKLHSTFRALFVLIYPPKHANVVQTEMVGLAGNKESTSVLGDPTDAKVIAKHSLDVVRRFSKAVFTQDIEKAYGLCANELRTGRSVKQFFTDLQKADTRYGGPAVDLMVERITWIYADEASRRRSNTDGHWPKETPKPNKRALVGTFWIVDTKTKRGRWVFFWITEESDGYRIAKLNQYLQ